MFDLDALIFEEEERPFAFRFGGEHYELPAHMDVRAVAAMSAGRLDAALRMMLGAEQWERMQASPATLDDRHLSKLFEAYAAHAGVTVGE